MSEFQLFCDFYQGHTTCKTDEHDEMDVTKSDRVLIHGNLLHGAPNQQHKKLDHQSIHFNQASKMQALKGSRPPP